MVNAAGTRVSRNTIVQTDLNDPDAGSAIFVGGNTTGLQVTDNLVRGGAATDVRVTTDFGSPSTTLNIAGNVIASRLNGVRISGAHTSVTLNRNTITLSGNDGILIDAGSSGLTIAANVAVASTAFDCRDDTTGSGTAGTANTWTGDIGHKRQPNGICIG